MGALRRSDHYAYGCKWWHEDVDRAAQVHPAVPDQRTPKSRSPRLRVKLMIFVHSKLRSSFHLVRMNCTSKRRNARKPVLAANVCPNLGHDFLETAPCRR